MEGFISVFGGKYKLNIKNRSPSSHRCRSTVGQIRKVATKEEQSVCVCGGRNVVEIRVQLFALNVYLYLFDATQYDYKVTVSATTTSRHSLPQKITTNVNLNLQLHTTCISNNNNNNNNKKQQTTTTSTHTHTQPAFLYSQHS